jgi:transcriptional regulator with XRE-family HTH domain
VPFCRGTPLAIKALRVKDYSENPQTLGEHLKARRRELGLLQREAADQMGIDRWTYINWEKDKTRPVAARFRPVIAFLGYDPTPEPKTQSERLEAKRRRLGVTFDQVAGYLGWDPGTLTRYLNGTWRIPGDRAASLHEFLSAAPAALACVRQFPRRSRGVN